LTPPCGKGSQKRETAGKKHPSTICSKKKIRGKGFEGDQKTRKVGVRKQKKQKSRSPKRRRRKKRKKERPKQRRK